MRSRRIVLIGPRAVGKSTVGRILSDRLGWPFLDTDSLVADRAALTIREIFEREGEAGFRRREREAALDVLQGEHAVIALGAGAVMDADIQQALQPARDEAPDARLGRGIDLDADDASLVVWLQASPDVLFVRMQSDPDTRNARPPLTSLPAEDELRHLLAARQPVYERPSTMRIDASALTPAEVADRILSDVHSAAADRPPAMPAEFVSEPIEPDALTFDAAAMARGEPGLPRGFTWRGEHHEIVELLESWKHTESWDHSTGDRYYRKHYYRVRTDRGDVMTLYALRHTKRGESRRKRWWLYAVERVPRTPTTGRRSSSSG